MSGGAEDVIDSLPKAPCDDDLDARSGGYGGANIYNQGDVEMKDRAFIESGYVYNMRNPKRGLAVIINNKNFERRTGMNDRNGTDVDAGKLFKLFMKLGFEVRMSHNQSTAQMMKIMSQAARENHRDNDCFACAVLSHGDEGVVYGTDGTVQVELLTAPFRGDRCPSLAGKPKLFFIQACRGNNFDSGLEVADGDEDDDETDAPQTHRIPTEADFLVAYSTVPGYYSWRNSTNGSWFVQAISKVFEEFSFEKEIMWLMTRVNYTVAYDFESNASRPEMAKKKQIPSIVSMLTKELYFTPKK